MSKSILPRPPPSKDAPLLRISKTYALPEKPKPGPKPGAKAKKSEKVLKAKLLSLEMENKALKEAQAQNMTQSQSQKQNQQQSQAQGQSQSQSLSQNPSHQHLTPESDATSRNASLSPVTANTSGSRPASSSSRDLLPGDIEIGEAPDCGLCDEGGDCVCSAIGLKSAPPHQSWQGSGEHSHIVLPPLPKATSLEADFSNVAGAVALKPRVGAKKIYNFKRPLQPIEPVHLNHRPLPQNQTSHSVYPTLQARPIVAHEHEQPVPNSHCTLCDDTLPCLCSKPVSNIVDTITSSKVHMDISASNNIQPTQPHYSTMTGASPKSRSTTPSSFSSPFSARSGPGTCELCEKDPMATLFCMSLNCAPSTEVKGLSISCMQAYQTLSRHPNFSKTPMESIAPSLNTDGQRVSVESLSLLLKKM